MALAALLVAVAAPAATTVRPWGDNAIRVQFCAGACSDTLSGALGAAPPATAADDAAPAQQQALGSGSPSSAAPAQQQALGGGSPVVSGNLKAALDGKGMLRFTRVDDGAALLAQTALSLSASGAGCAAAFDFSPSATTVFGMGQNRPAQADAAHRWMYDTRSLDVRNQTFDFATTMGNEGGATNSAPYIVGASPKGGFAFGLLFNSPSFGGMNFTQKEVTCFTAADSTAWSTSADLTNVTIRRQLDFLIVTSAAKSPPAQRAHSIAKAYTAAVGRAMKMPAWGSQYWHCKNRCERAACPASIFIPASG